MTYASLIQRDLEDLRGQLQSERGIVVSLREELSHLQSALEASNDASFEAQRRLGQEQTALQRERLALQDSEEANRELRRDLANAACLVAEKESVVEAQHRDIMLMRNQLGRHSVSS